MNDRTSPNNVVLFEVTFVNDLQKYRMVGEYKQCDWIVERFVLNQSLCEVDNMAATSIVTISTIMKHLLRYVCACTVI